MIHIIYCMWIGSIVSYLLYQTWEVLLKIWVIRDSINKARKFSHVLTSELVIALRHKLLLKNMTISLVSLIIIYFTVGKPFGYLLMSWLLILDVIDEGMKYGLEEIAHYEEKNRI